MRPDVRIPARWAAMAAARSSEIEIPSGNDTLVIDLFCDGSFKGRPSRAGIGIVVNVCLPRSTTKQRTSKSCFIPCRPSGDDNNNTTEAFALAEGAYVALEKISSLKSQTSMSIRPTDRIEVIFWSDSQLVLLALDDPRCARTLSKKMQHLLDIIKLKTRELHQSSADVSVQFRWCPEECIEPHATADEISKGARMSGRIGTKSKALALFLGVSHREIKSALSRSRLVQPPAALATQLPSLGAGNTSTAKSAELSKQQSAPLATTNTDSRRPPYDQSLVLDLALGTITEDSLMMNALYRDATTSRFFSIVGANVKVFSSELRSSMHKAIRDQREANKQARWYIPVTSGETYRRYPNLFALIEIAASSLPAHQEKQVLDAIALQKDVNKSVLKNEIAKKPAKDVDDPMLIAEPEFPNGHEIIQEPHRTAEQPADNTGESRVLEESETLDGQIVPEQPEQPEVLAEPEIFVQARPNRMRAAWNWVGRRFRRL